MPVEILDDSGTTSVTNATIKLTDLQKMLTDYRQHVTPVGRVNGNTVITKDRFYFSKRQLDDLFATNPDATGIEISLAVQLPGSNVPCHDQMIDTSNTIVAVISGAIVDTENLIYQPFNDVGKTVLINGYNVVGAAVAGGSCCPGTKPP